MGLMESKFVLWLMFIYVLWWSCCVEILIVGVGDMFFLRVYVDEFLFNWGDCLFYDFLWYV